MRIRYRIAVISLIVLSTATASSGGNYTRGEATLPPDTMLSGTGSNTNPSIRVGEVEQQRLRGTLRSPGPPLPSTRTEADDSDTIRQQKKTLAILILMLRDGRGAR
jgi:hypothetical protein